MAENHDLEPIQAAGLRVAVEPRLQVASLRYFDAQGAFARLLRDITGLTLPDSLCALSSTADLRSEAIILAWRSPTETLMISNAPGLIETLQSAAATVTDGCIVDQRGGALVFRASGESVADLFARVGGHGACPASGESLRTRMADVAVLAVKVQPEETLLMVERSYAPHLMAAMRLSAADLAVPLFC
jgi:sarcosine oxidase gamma subunit